MITKDTFLVSFNIQGEGFCEPFLVTYRTEELNPYLRYPRQTLNPNHLHVHFTKQVIRELMKMPYYDNEVQDVIHSLNEDLAKAKQEIVDQVNNIYGNEKLTFFSLQGIQKYFETIHLECQEISFNRGGTVIQKQGIPEL